MEDIDHVFLKLKLLAHHLAGYGLLNLSCLRESHRIPMYLNAGVLNGF